MNNLHQKFWQDGFVELPGFLSQEELRQLLADLAQAEQKIEHKSGLNREGLTFHSNLFKQSEAVAHFIGQAKILNLIRAITKSEIWVRWDQTITKAPGGKPFPWHRDNAYNRLTAEHFQFWIALTPMNEQNGGLWLLPKSHTWSKIKHIKDQNHWAVANLTEKGICVDAKPGDALLFSSKMLHKTEINQTNEHRTAYVIEYMKQSDFDPIIAAPYLFLANEGIKWLAKHPKSGWLSGFKSKILGLNINKVRHV